MSAVNNITTNTAPAGYTAEGIVGNLSKVLKEIYPQKADNMVAQGMITEEQLFAAFAFGELEKKKPKLAGAILGDLKEQFQALKQGGDIRPLYHAMEKAIDNAVARGRLTSQERSQIIRTSLGMAQLDNRDSFLSARKIKFEDQGSVAAGTTYMDRVLSKIADNTAFTAADVKTAEKRMSALDARGIEYAPLKKSPITVTHQGANSAPSEVLTETPVANGSSVQFHATEFGYKPVSSQNGKALVQIPAQYSAELTKVEIVNSASEVIASVVPNMVNQNGCRVALFDKKGDEFGPSFRIRFSFTNRSDHYWDISDSHKVSRYTT